MCFPFDAIVPELPEGFQVIAGGAAGELLTLTSADGTEFSAYLARADGPTGVVVLPDVRGLFRFYEQLAERFAAAGHPAIAIDYFGRTAGLGPRDEDFEYMPHIQQTTPETVALDVAAALAALGADRARSRSASASAARSRSCRPTMGHAGLAGVVGFYGSLKREGRRWALDRAPETKVPVLGLFAGDDAEHHARPGRGVRRRAAGRARDPRLRGRPALVLRPPPGAVQGRVQGRVGAHPRLHRAAGGDRVNTLSVLGERDRRAGAGPRRVDALRCTRSTPTAASRSTAARSGCARSPRRSRRPR